MKKHLLTTTENEIEQTEKRELQRRIFMYSKSALKIGITIDHIMVNHTRFAQGIQALDRIYQLAHELNLPQGIRIIGPTGSGKTSLVNYFSRTLPKTTLFKEGLGIVMTRLDASPTRHQLVRNLLVAYNYPFATTSIKAIDIKTQVLCDIIRQKGTRILAIDESHHMAFSKSKRYAKNSQNDVTDLLHDIMDVTGVGLFLMGTEELDDLERLDPHLASRVSTRIELSNYETLTPEWYGLLKAFVTQSKQFDLSVILTENYGALIHAATGGNLRNLKRLITEVVLIGVDSQDQVITKSTFHLAHERIYGEGNEHANPFTK